MTSLERLVEIFPDSDDSEPPDTIMDSDSHVRQGKHLCGPACAEMLLKYWGFQNISQDDIAYKYGVFVKDWGTPPENLEKFFKGLFGTVGVERNVTLDDVKQHLEDGLPAMTLIQDIFPDRELQTDLSDKLESKEDGHWVNFIEVTNDHVMVADPSNAERQYDDDGFVRTEVDPDDKYEFRPFYKIRRDIFEKIWYDYLQNGERVDSLIVWFDPLSKIASQMSADEKKTIL